MVRYAKQLYIITVFHVQQLFLQHLNSVEISFPVISFLAMISLQIIASFSRSDRDITFIELRWE